MKKLLILIITMTFVVTTYSQDSISKNKIYHNEFGIDATGFAKQFFNFSSAQYQPDYTPAYLLTYRRHFKHGNLRFAIGGSYTSYDLPPSANDLNTYHFRDHSFAFKLGYEFFSNLSKRWQVFYGADLRSSWSYSKDDAPYWNGGYANGQETNETIRSISPLLGFRFRINSRLSLSTETSFSINYFEGKGKYYFIPETSDYPPMSDVKIPKSSRMYTSFAQPIAIIIAFDI